MMRLGIASVLLLLPFAACSSSTEEPEARPDTASSSSSSPAQEPADSPADDESEPSGPVEDVTAIANGLKGSLPDVLESIKLTEDNDANDLIGRPGQYDAAVFLALDSLGCSGPDYDELSIDCGIKLERWPSADDAAARAHDIQTKLQTYGLGAEWDYGAGRVLLRIAGDVPPSQATKIRDAFAKATNAKPVDLAT
ncbi:hypothetical protein [Nocardioides panaciterrulae]|uniref:SPOR domain-containing protein n=1 Tax=Nocardioides panaciterrulae TaxID=661492 RepID=A0A7Y9E2Z3_9ACTN|nr:hypothetical protein [Nocardioides panaciterrulae]NYD40062.1 hypothetical protein [Nocardioides panaciterrulae]